MKQKVVIRVPSNGNKNCQSKALQIAAGFPGVNSAAFEREKTQIVVTGVNVDMVELTDKLKKKLGFAKLLTVTLLDQDDKGKNDDDDKPTPWPNCHGSFPPSGYYYLYDAPPYPCHSHNCTFL